MFWRNRKRASQSIYLPAEAGDGALNIKNTSRVNHFNSNSYPDGYSYPANIHPLHSQDPARHEPLIRMCGVTKAYQTVNGSFEALKGINLDIYPGEFVAIVGKSGAGKTTLINMLTGVDHLTSGEVWVDGTPVHELDENRLALWRGRKLGIIYQSFHLMPTLSLMHNVLLPMDFCGLYQGRKSAERALDLLRQVELQDHAHKLPSAISGGQQQRVAIARALANDPPIIVADEPTGRLDSTTAEMIFSIFQSLVAQGKTIVMVTHDRSLAQRVTRTIHLSDGEIVRSANSLSGISQPANRNQGSVNQGIGG